MELKEYFKQNKIKQRDFAKLVPCTYQYISMLANKKYKAGKYLTHRILTLTEGKVTLEDLNCLETKKNQE